jgi:peptidoglycan/LPS O-acetylase OafA/YrhL
MGRRTRATHDGAAVRQRGERALYAAAIIMVRRRAAGRAERRYGWGTWGLAVIFALAALMNVASASQWENYLMAPVALVLAALCVIVARAPSGHRGRMPEGPPATAARA